MEISQIRNFVKIAETGQLTQAAKDMHISQPNMSSSIRSLESELGLLLFDRSGRNLTLNENGRQFYYYASHSLYFLEDGIEEMKKRRKVNSTNVTITVLAGTMILPYLLKRIYQAIPDTHISIINQGLEEHPALWDISLSASASAPNNTEQYALFHQSLALMVPETHVLAQRSSVSLQEIREESIITWPESLMMGKIIRQYFKHAEIDPHIVLETDDGTLTTRLVRAGIGVALAPARTPAPPQVCFIPISEPQCTRYIIAQSRSQRPIVKKVFECITSIPYHDFVNSESD